MYKIIQTKTEYIKNPTTKTTYIQTSKEVSEVFEKEYYLTVNDKTVKYFRRLGGFETLTRAYTFAGFKVVKHISTSPDKKYKVLREFKFEKI